MTPVLRTELKQRKPFTSLEQEAFLNVARTEATLRDHLDRVLKPFGISVTQYNVLRILRGAGQGGLCRNEIRGRLVDRMPDVTRLLDRMEETGWITRSRSTEDRRQVSTYLTRSGRDLVDSLDEPVAAEHAQRLGHLSKTQLRTLIDLLSAARQAT
jgi:DNA-binding MarR family transcriptional regulator